MKDLPITHILLATGDATHAVKALSTRGPIKRGYLYRMLAVDRRAKVAVALPGDLANPIEDKDGGQWFPMDLFTWAIVDGDGIVVDPANDN